MLTRRAIPGGFLVRSLGHSLGGAISLVALLNPHGMNAAMARSDGSGGPFHPTSSQRLVLNDRAPDGVFHFTTIHIPANVIIRFERNDRNTPVFLAATGEVTIDGTIEVSGASYAPGGGPGGWDGGVAGSHAAGSPGLGPAGGAGGPPPSGQGNAGGGGGMATDGGTATSRSGPSPGMGGRSLWRPVLVPGQTGGGGSGGGGGGGRLFHGVDISGGSGGGGGGALQIATPGLLTLRGSLVANGGHGGWAFANVFAHGGPGGGGAGGHIELYAGEFLFGTNATLEARGGAGGGLSTEPVPRDPYHYSSGAHGGLGYVYINRIGDLPRPVVVEGVVDDRARILRLTYDKVSGIASLEYRGLAGVEYTIQSSVNLSDWVDRTHQTAGWEAVLAWTDEAEPSRFASFYRVRQR